MSDILQTSFPPRFSPVTPSYPHHHHQDQETRERGRQPLYVSPLVNPTMGQLADPAISRGQLDPSLTRAQFPPPAAPDHHWAWSRDLDRPIPSQHHQQTMSLQHHQQKRTVSHDIEHMSHHQQNRHVSLQHQQTRHVSPHQQQTRHVSPYHQQAPRGQQTSVIKTRYVDSDIRHVDSDERNVSSHMANRDMRHGCNSESFGLESKNQRSVDHSQPIGGQYSGEIKQEAASSSCSSDEDHIPKTIESTNQRSLNHSRPMRGQYPDHVISLNQSEDRSIELANGIPQTVTSHQNHRGRDSKLNR